MYRHFFELDNRDFETITFPRSTKTLSLSAREKFIRDHPDRVDFRGLPRQVFIDRCILPVENVPDVKSKYGFWNLFPVKTSMASWSATLRVFPVTVFPDVQSDIVARIVSSAKIAMEEKPDTGWESVLTNFSNFKSSLRGFVRKHIHDLQLSEFLTDKSTHGLPQFRRHWYHDPLLLRLATPSARTIRKMRLGSSELASDSFFFTENSSKICKYCSLNVVETPEHFFTVCSSFQTQRVALLRQIRPALTRLGLRFSAASCLGFCSRLRIRSFERATRRDRLTILEAVDEFITTSERFSYM